MKLSGWLNVTPDPRVGKLWFDDVSFEPVSTDVPTTDVLGSTPRNLDFESMDR